MSFTPPPLPSIPGITDANISGGFAQPPVAPPAPPTTDAIAGANVSDAVYTQTANAAAAGAETGAAAGAADAGATPPPTKTKRAKSTSVNRRAVSASNTAAGAGVQAAKFELPELLAIRVDKLNAENPNDERLLLLRAMQMTEVDFATVDHALGHTVGATADYIGAEAAPSVGARKMYAAVMLAMGTLYQARLLPGPTDMHQSLLLLALRTHSLESMLAVAQDELVKAQANSHGQVQAQAYAQNMNTPAFQPQPAQLPPTHAALPQHQTPVPAQQFQPQAPVQPMAGQLPGAPHQFMPPQPVPPVPQQAPSQMTYEQWAHAQAQLQAQQQQAAQPQWQPQQPQWQPGANTSLPPGFTPPFQV